MLASRWRALKYFALGAIVVSLLATFVFLIGDVLLEKLFNVRTIRHSNLGVLFLVLTLVCFVHAGLLWLISSILKIKTGGGLAVVISIAVMILLFVVIGLTTFGIDLEDAYTAKNIVCLILISIILPFITFKFQKMLGMRENDSEFES